MKCSIRSAAIAAAVFCALALTARPASAESLCDPSISDCRTPLLALIDAENVGIDAGFWFMEDQRYATHIIARWNAGVPVRLIVDPRANPTYPLNAQMLDMFQQAGIPMVQKSGGGIMHWKTMLFAGQNIVEFGSANYSPNGFVPDAPYTNYVSETVFFEDDAAIVNSFRTKFDNLWTDTANYVPYANVSSRTRVYPTYTISADMNFPPGQDYANRAVKLYNAETQQIDVDMYRVTDRRHTDAIIAAYTQRHVPVRYMGETREYRDPTRLWVAWNMDRIYAAGIPLRVRASEGENHEKLVLLYAQAMTIFGSSNWTSPSANSQQEHNYFTTKSWIFQWFEDQFNRKWNNSAGYTETAPFAPLPPDKPTSPTPADTAAGVSTTGVSLKWYGGPWAHVYDIYFGTDPNPPLFAANQALGPSESATQFQSFALPTLSAGTTYYWKIVSKTMANLTATGPVWSFTTAGTPPPPPPPPTGATTVVMWTANVPSANIHGNWARLSDSTAAGSSALWNPNAGQSKIAPALASPANYFEQTFTAYAGTAYHLWVRLRAQGNSLANDSVHVQFSGSVDQFGSAVLRIGTSSSAEVVLQDGPNDAADTNWGWADNGWGTLGSNVYFAATGPQTVRVQQREDGAIVDQIVLSPDTYLATAPGPRDNDATILPSTDGVPPPPPPGPLPSPWQSSDIGAVGVAGSATYSNGTYTVQGAGADVWGTSDAFRYGYQPLSGDGSIVARVASVQNVNAWTKAGVMIRQTLDANSSQASMFVTPLKGLAFQRRQTTGGTSLNTSVSGSAPRWVRLDRAGQTVTASVSTDGTTWTQVGQDTIALSGTVWVGLAVTSHDASQLATASFDSVTITP